MEETSNTKALEEEVSESQPDATSTVFVLLPYRFLLTLRDSCLTFFELFSLVSVEEREPLPANFKFPQVA